MRASKCVFPRCRLMALVAYVTASNVVDNLLRIDAHVSRIRVVVKTSPGGDLDSYVRYQDQRGNALSLRVAE